MANFSGEAFSCLTGAAKQEKNEGHPRNMIVAKCGTPTNASRTSNIVKTLADTTAEEAA